MLEGSSENHSYIEQVLAFFLSNQKPEIQTSDKIIDWFRQHFPLD
jgi:hypothetical protein